MLPFPCALLVPSSLTQQEPDRRVRTFKVGLVGRAASIFGVREIVVYREPSFNDARFIEAVLRYQECPPYLRKLLFRLTPELRDAGVLPALNTPSHVVGREPRAGEVREAVATRSGIEMGSARPARAVKPLPEGERVRVRVVAAGREVLVEPFEGEGPYGGFAVRRAASLAQALEGFDLRIAASRRGEPAGKLQPERLRGRVALAFGPPERSVEEVLAAERAAVDWDFVLNAAPGQETASVRTEEAVYMALAALAARVA